MKGSPAKLGEIAGTDGHASALKQNEEAKGLFGEGRAEHQKKTKKLEKRMKKYHGDVMDDMWLNDVEFENLATEGSEGSKKYVKASEDADKLYTTNTTKDVLGLKNIGGKLFGDKIQKRGSSNPQTEFKFNPLHK